MRRRSRLAGIEVGLENLGDPMAALFQVGPAGVVNCRVAGLEHARDPARDLHKVQTRQSPRIRGWSGVSSSQEDDVAEEIAVRARVAAQDHVAQPAQIFALKVASDGRKRGLPRL